MKKDMLKLVERSLAMKKYVHSILRYFTLYAFGFALLFVLGALIQSVYASLSDTVPTVFPSYNPITQKAELTSLEATLSLISATVTVFILTFITVKYDNERFSFMISETDGFYTLREGGKIYLQSYLYADLVSSVCVPLPFLLMTQISFPEDSVKSVKVFENILETILSTTSAFVDKLGFFGGALAAIAVSILSRFPAGYSGLKRWRGMWLSDVDRRD